MYAVTGAPKEYQDEVDTQGTVILVLIEQCRANTTDLWGDYAGWDLYWFNDGSNVGCFLIEDEDGQLQPVYDGITPEDVFTDAQLETIEEGKYIITDSPFGVKQRVLDNQEDRPDNYYDLKQLLSAGRIDCLTQTEQCLAD